MSMTPGCVLLGFLAAALMLLSDSSASPVPQHQKFQAAIHKRIFCNFYGCGQKRSGGGAGQHDALNDAEDEDADVDAFNRNFLMEPQALDSAQSGELGASRESEKYLRAVFDALRDRLAVPSHRMKKRNV